MFTCILFLGEKRAGKFFSGCSFVFSLPALPPSPAFLPQVWPVWFSAPQATDCTKFTSEEGHCMLKVILNGDHPSLNVPLIYHGRLGSHFAKWDSACRPLPSLWQVFWEEATSQSRGGYAPIWLPAVAPKGVSSCDSIGIKIPPGYEWPCRREQCQEMEQLQRAWRRGEGEGTDALWSLIHIWLNLAAFFLGFWETEQ